jgi:chemotaxis signal transduction protein
VQPDSQAPLLVWRRGEALLAAEVDAIVEVAMVPADGDVRSREGSAPLVDLPGLRGDRPDRAVVVRTGSGLAALPADSLEGIRGIARDRLSAPPGWLGALVAAHLRAIVVLDDDRLAALLALASLGGASR